jgi:GT2 family glycosyltransferase
MAAGAPSVRIQVVLFRQTLAQLWRLVPGVTGAARHAVDAKLAGRVTLAFGDSSPRPSFDEEDLRSLEKLGVESGLDGLSYEFFNANLGSSGGSNRLAESCTDDFVLVLNPDTYPAPTLLTRMLSLFHDPLVGAVDAHQNPLEHPKEYDPVTGDTSWLSGSCLLARNDVFQALKGFDSEHFFLYCDDVDFSWRVRLQGLRTVHEPRAVVFHDKRIGENGHIVPTPLEHFYGALGRLMLTHKYDRPDLVEETITAIESGGTPHHRAAVDEWRRRKAAGAVPPAVARAASVAQFVGGEYARHRF